MKGTRPLDNTEIQKVSACFAGTFAVRNRGLFLLGVSTGGRISELLSLSIGDVYQNFKAVRDLLFDRNIVKGQENSRAVPVNADGRQAIEDLIDWHREEYDTVGAKRPLFPSRNGSGAVAMDRRTAHQSLKKAFTAAGLNGKLATHSLRKSFAQRLYEASGDIYLVQELLGHRNIATTQKYIGVSYATAKQAVEVIAVGAEALRNDADASETSASFVNHMRVLPGKRDRTDLLSNSVSDAPDDTLLLELLRRGYDVSAVINKPTAFDGLPSEISEFFDRLTTRRSV